jgi:hypothetical protein
MMAASTSCTWFSTLLPLFTALGGFLVALISIWFQNRLTIKREREAKLEQRYRENIEQSVTGFVDEMLTLISHAYWNKAEGRDPEIASILEVLREKQALIQARLKAMRRPDVEKYFLALDKSFVQFRAELPKAPGGKAYDLMREAWNNAGAFFEAVYGSSPKDS